MDTEESDPLFGEISTHIDTSEQLNILAREHPSLFIEYLKGKEEREARERERLYEASSEDEKKAYRSDEILGTDVSPWSQVIELIGIMLLIILISVFNDIKIKMKLFSSYLASLSGLMTLVPYYTTRTPLKMPITTGRVEYCGQSSKALPTMNQSSM